LLEQVERGDEGIITRHGRAGARLVPAATATRDRLVDAVARLEAALGKGGGAVIFTIEALIEEVAGDRPHHRYIIGTGVAVGRQR
jgi:hypothetical protein